MSSSAFASVIPVFVGTYTRDGRSKGLYYTEIRSEAGALSLAEPRVAAVCSNPTFLALHPSKPWLYATGDVKTESGVEGALLAFDFSAGFDKPLQALGQLRTGVGYAPCHIMVSRDGAALVATHYNTGVVVSAPLLASGAPGPLGSSVVHSGVVGPNKARQDRPHTHSVTLSPEGRYAYICDLGLDRIYRYTLDSKAGTLSATEPTSFVATPGVGPRHAKVGPGGRDLYVVNELGGSVSVYAIEAASGDLRHLQTLSALPAGYTGENTSAEIQVHPNGRFVYASNRGPDCITVLSRDEKTGLLTVVEQVSSGGGHPRHFALSPDGAFLLCANRDANNLVLFKIDAATGRLQATGCVVQVPSAVCVAFPRAR